jgi:hypothetical protein
MIVRWRGRRSSEEQVANARDSTVNLAPVSDAPAQRVWNNWAAVLTDHDPIREDDEHG